MVPFRWKDYRRPPKPEWAIPPDANAAFVAGMEDVLEGYQRPHNPACPVVCVDETSKQLVAETRVPIKAKPSRTARSAIARRMFAVREHRCACGCIVNCDVSVARVILLRAEFGLGHGLQTPSPQVAR